MPNITQSPVLNCYDLVRFSVSCVGELFHLQKQATQRHNHTLCELVTGVSHCFMTIYSLD